ncbi:CAIB BAIF family enzyme protein [Rutstroemia sp. NJR-2017a BBW]|nr:CAIB BAIF family enzyme protein [Rutstroemia sp. NJR-2017a BBW]
MRMLISSRSLTRASRVLRQSNGIRSAVKQTCRRGLANATTNGMTLPLEGYKVLDLTRVLAGPYCTQILGDLGAEVIKVEHPVRGDDTRHWGPPYAKYLDGSGKEGPGESAYFFAVNRNKKSLGLSFKHTSAVKILHKLAMESDILVENYLPGSLKKYGMDYETLRELNPRLIYASITGYGQTGPYRNRAGYDVMVEAEMGLMHITGSRDGPPVKVGVAVTDLTTGLYTSNSIMAALLARGKTGRGQHIDVALSDCQVATLSNLASSCLISGEKDEGRWGTAHRHEASIVPYRSYKTKDGDILFGGGNDRLFGLLCDGLGCPEWKEDPRFVVNTQRVAHRAELDSSIEKITQDKTTREWLDIFEGSGLPYAAINDIQGTLNHEHVLARDMIKEMDHEYCGRIKMVNTPVKYSESKPSIRSVPPMLGQHTDEILRDILGMDDTEIKALKAEGAVAYGILRSSQISISSPAQSSNSQKSQPTRIMDATPQTPAPAAAPSNTSMSDSPPKYVPKFSAATELILQRMKSGLGGGLSSIGITGTPPGYEEMRRNVMQGMKTTHNMEINTPPKHNTGRRTAPRRVGSAEKSTTPTASASSAGGKKKGKGAKAGQKRKRAKDDSDSADDSDAMSALGGDSESEGTSSVTTEMPKITQSGRQVVKPTHFVPAMTETSTRKKSTTSTSKRSQEQALCKRCGRGNSPQNNMIVFCDGCNLGWHQLCHDPIVSEEEVKDEKAPWYCQNCSRKRGIKPAPSKADGISWADKTLEQVLSSCFVIFYQSLTSYNRNEYI